jgi:predicted DNA-binding protein (MmcQ/YjbR family)
MNTRQAELLLRDYALSFPETHEDFPWGERALKVKKKVFLFMRASEESLHFSTKLTKSNLSALDLPFTEPTHYGLGKHGWVSASIQDGQAIPIELIRGWIDESYRNVAPKTLVAKLGAAAKTSAAKTPGAAEPAVRRAAKKAKQAKKLATRPLAKRSRR